MLIDLKHSFVVLDYFIESSLWMKVTQKVSLITIFLLIFTRAIALMKVRKMFIREKLVINLIHSGVTIDTYHIDSKFS